MFINAVLVVTIISLSVTTATDVRLRSDDDHGSSHGSSSGSKNVVQVGERPYYLVEDMESSPLKSKLQTCANSIQNFQKSDWSISHRGAPLQFPEETVAAIEAGARMGAGILECDVTFTKDLELVCRHSQCDLHTTTNIVDTPLVQKCTSPPVMTSSTPFTNVKCCTSDITLAEFKTLHGKMDGSNAQATTATDYMKGTPSWRTDLNSPYGVLVTLNDFIDIAKKWGLKMTPELKAPEVTMPFNGLTQEQYAQKMINTFKAKGVSAKNVFPQSFNVNDIYYWLKNEPAFGKQAVNLEELNSEPDVIAATASIAEKKKNGVTIIAPPIWTLLTTDTQNKIVASEYAKALKKANMKIIAWSLERSGPLSQFAEYKTEFYFQSVTSAIKRDGDLYVALDVLAKDVGVMGVFSDWPATTTFYANCMKFK